MGERNREIARDWREGFTSLVGVIRDGEVCQVAPRDVKPGDTIVSGRRRYEAWLLTGR